MFNSSLEIWQQWWLGALLVLWAALLFGGFLFGRPTDLQKTGRIPTWARIASSLVLVVASWSWYLFSITTPAASFGLLLALGMTLGFLGDLFMAHLLPLSPPELGGMTSFGLGHVAYIGGILLFAGQQGLDAPGPRWGAWLMWLLFGAVGWYIVVFRRHIPTMLHYAALPYALLLASTAGFATGLALQAPGFGPLAIGAALFLISDLIIAAQLFNKLHFPLIRDAIWLTYGPAQALIVYAVAAALQITIKS